MRTIDVMLLHQIDHDTGVEIKYPDDTPYPSRLTLGWSGQRPIHVVAADVDDESATVIVTVYEPHARVWDADFKRRRQS